MDIDVRKQSNTNIIRLRGDLKIGQAAEDLKRTLGEFLANNEVRFVVNMQDVNMVDSSGIGVLVRSLTSAKQRGGSLKLVNPSKLTLQTLKMVGLLPRLKQCDNILVLAEELGMSRRLLYTWCEPLELETRGEGSPANS